MEDSGLDNRVYEHIWKGGKGKGQTKTRDHTIEPTPNKRAQVTTKRNMIWRTVKDKVINANLKLI